MKNIFRLVLIFLLFPSAMVLGQTPRKVDSLRLIELDSILGVKSNIQQYDSGILYAKEMAARTFSLYGTGKEYAYSLFVLGFFYKSNFNYREAEDCDKKAIATQAQYAGKKDSVYAGFINNLAALYDDIGDYGLADSLYHESLSIRKNMPGDSSAYAESLNNLGFLYLEMQQYPAAKNLLNHSLLISKRIKDSFSYAQTLNTIGLLNQKTGNYGLAETQYKEALGVIDSCCSDQNELWNINNNLALLYYEMNNYKDAAKIHKKVLAHLIDKFHRKITDYATTLSLLARDYSKEEEYDSSLVYLKEASEIYLKELPGAQDHPDYATNLDDIAEVFEKKGELDSAKKYYTRVLEIREKNFGSEAPVYAQALNKLGLVYIKEKEFKTAETYIQHAATIMLNKFGAVNAEYTQTLNNLLESYYESDDYTDWARLADTAVTLWRNSITHLLFSFGEKDKQNYLESHLEQRDAFLSMLWHFSKTQNTGSFQSTCFRMITALQGWLMTGNIELNKVIKQKKDNNLKNLYNKWIGVKNLYNQTLQMSETQRKMQHMDSDSLMRLSTDLEKLLIDKLPEVQKSLENTAVSGEKIAASLKDDEVLINWVSFKYRSPKNLTDSVLYAAFIISPKDPTPRFVAAFEQKKITALLHSYFNYSGRGIIVKSAHINKNIGKDSYHLIWEPVLPFIKNKKKVYIVSSGQLNKISFAAMEDSTDISLLESMEIHLLDNTNEIYGSSGSSSNMGKSIALFGGADFDKNSSGDQLKLQANKMYNYLPGSKEEVKHLSQIFRLYKWKTKLFIGVCASEENFKALSRKVSPTILHIATHGFYISPDSIGNIAPLLRSGFVLSGANLNAGNRSLSLNREDGIVKAQEISDLNFTNTELVTLSACESALGDIDNNEGVYGLQRSFKIAGVKKMLISLWSIPDNETKDLMDLFYKYVFEGNSYSQALRKAQLSMKRKYGDPAKWAAFELIGE